MVASLVAGHPTRPDGPSIPAEAAQLKAISSFLCVLRKWPAPAQQVRGAPQATHGAGCDRVEG